MKESEPEDREDCGAIDRKGICKDFSLISLRLVA